MFKFWFTFYNNSDLFFYIWNEKIEVKVYSREFFITYKDADSEKSCSKVGLKADLVYLSEFWTPANRRDFFFYTRAGLPRGQNRMGPMQEFNLIAAEVNSDKK